MSNGRARSSSRASKPSRRAAPPSGPDSSPATSSSPSTAGRSPASPTCSGSSARAPDETLNIVVDRHGRQVTLTATPDLKEQETPVRQAAHRPARAPGLARPGRHRSSSPTVRSEPLQAGVMETWYVVERTFDLPRQAGRRARIGGPALGPDPDRAGVGPGRDASAASAALISLVGRAVGLDRADQPVPDSAARWRAPVVLCDRGRCAGRPLSERAQEIGFRIGLADRGDADAVRHLERHRSSGRVVCRPRDVTGT